MTGMSPRARELIHTASRHEALPSEARLQRVRANVLRRAALGLVAGAAGSTGFLAKAAAWGATGVGHIAVFTVVGALAGGAAVRIHSASVVEQRPVTRNTQIARTSAIEQAPAATPPRAPAAIAEAAPLVVSAPIVTANQAPRSPVLTPRKVATQSAPMGSSPITPSSEPRTGARPLVDPEVTSPGLAVKPVDLLSRQLDTLRRMRFHLAERESVQALTLYRESESSFRGGALEPEARAALIAALCQLGRTDEARLENDRFLLAFPDSHLARRLSTGCPDVARDETSR